MLESPPLDEVRHPLARRAIALLESASAVSTLTLVTIAQRLDVRPSHLARVFYAATGSLEEHAAEIASLDATLCSKLADIEEVATLLGTL